MKNTRYQIFSEKYKPENITTLFIAESPPIKIEGKESRYFYFDDAYKGDTLLRSIMDALFPNIYKKNKQDKIFLLQTLKKNGYFLIDSTDIPINHIKNVKQRDMIIKNDYDKLLEKLEKLIDKKTNVILIKKNVYHILKSKLLKEGYNVINTTYLNFPSHGNQIKFKEGLRRLLK